MTSNGQLSAWSAVSQWLQCPVDEELPASQAGRNGNVRRRYIYIIYSTKGILGLPLDEVSIIHHTSDSIGLGWTLDTGLEKQTSSRVDLSKTLGDTPKSKMSMFMFFFFPDFSDKPMGFFSGVSMGLPFLERPGGRRARKEQWCSKVPRRQPRTAAGYQSVSEEKSQGLMGYTNK